jgi:hypothetical protein
VTTVLQTSITAALAAPARSSEITSELTIAPTRSVATQTMPFMRPDIDPNKFYQKMSFVHPICSFLNTRDLTRVERVNSTFQESAERCWGDRCCKEISLPKSDDLMLPAGMSAKSCFLFLIDTIFDERVYERHIGNVETAPPISKAAFLRLCNTPDPCDPTKIIGREYILMYIPESITITQKGISLSKEDDPNDPQAPQLIRGDSTSEKTLKVAVTINNLAKLFSVPKAGVISNYLKPSEGVISILGDQRVLPGWVCMRKDVIGLGLSFTKQQELAIEKGVIIPEIISRILFHFLFQILGHQENSEFGRTSSLINIGFGSESCGCSRDLNYLKLCCRSDDYLTGLSVALPAKVLKPEV